MAYTTFNINLQDSATGKSIAGADGICQVNITGTQRKATLYNPDAGFVTLANPVTIAGGGVRFAVATGVPGQASPNIVDIYGITSRGHAFSRTGIRPGDPAEVWLDTGRRYQVAYIPFSVADCTPGTEKNTGFALPAGALVLPNPMAVVTVAAGQGSKTVNFGLLSTESGGDADGYVAGLSLTSIANLKATLNGASPSLGALLNVASVAGTEKVPEGALIAAATHLSYTITSAATLAEGYIVLPYILTSVPAI